MINHDFCLKPKIINERKLFGLNRQKSFCSFLFNNKFYCEYYKFKKNNFSIYMMELTAENEVLLRAEIDEMIEGGIEKANQHGALGVPQKKLWEMADYFKIVKSNRKKEELITAIFNHVRDERRLEAKKRVRVSSNVILTMPTQKAPSDSESSEDEAEYHYGADNEFRAVKPKGRALNTFPRLLNFMMKHPDKLALTALQASKSQLQAKEVYEKNPVFVEAVISFNNWSLHSGGLVTLPEENTPDFIFLHNDIDPEVPPPRKNARALGNKDAYNMWIEVKKNYAAALKKFEQSGHHANDDFWSFCGGSTDVYYLRKWLLSTKNPGLDTLCGEGTVFEGGFDTGESYRSPSASSSNGLSTPSARPRSDSSDSVGQTSRKLLKYVQESDISNQASRAIVIQGLEQAKFHHDARIQGKKDFKIKLLQLIAAEEAKPKTEQSGEYLSELKEELQITRDEINQLRNEKEPQL